MWTKPRLLIYGSDNSLDTNNNKRKRKLVNPEG